MRDKISKAANGIFEYAASEPVISLSELQIEVNAGENVQGSFTVTNEASEPMRGEVGRRRRFPMSFLPRS